MAQRASAITARITGVADRLRPQRRGRIDIDALTAEVLRHYPRQVLLAMGRPRHKERGVQDIKSDAAALQQPMHKEAAA